MLELQRTIAEPVTLTGDGLHTGAKTKLTFKPAPENHGVRFVRVDIEGSPEVPALCDHVVDVSRGTTLALDGAKVHTVEHVLAAVAGLQIDNIRVEIDGPEPPVGDGSAKIFVDALAKAGFQQQTEPKDYLVIDRAVQYEDEERQVTIVGLPLDDFRATVMIDYQNPALGSQHTGLFDLDKEFVPEFSTSRTFCFLSEVEELSKQGLIKGGDLDNAVVIQDKELDQSALDELSGKLNVEKTVKMGGNGILNDKALRFKNEPARHKLLDLLGDLALIGAPIKAQILAARPGHKANVEFAKAVRKLYLEKQIVKKYQNVKQGDAVFDIEAIQKILPHRYPFLLIDLVLEVEFDKRVVASKNVSANEPFFAGHFPGRPIMPGVLIIESMAQAGGVLLLNSIPDPTKKLVMFMQINNAKFRKPVVPGDQLRLEIEMGKRRARFVTMLGKAYVGNAVVAEADFMAALVDRDPSEG